MKLNSRMVVVLGGLAMIVGPFLKWTEVRLGPGFSREGVKLEWVQFFDHSQLTLADSIFISAGMMIVVLGILAMVGAFVAPWMSRIAGLVAIALVSSSIVDFITEGGVAVGLWLTLAGAITVVGGTFIVSEKPSIS